MLAACRGDEAEATSLIAAVEHEAIARGQGVVLTFCEHARAILHNGLGHYDLALSAAQQASARDELTVSNWALVELVEAAAAAARDPGWQPTRSSVSGSERRWRGPSGRSGSRRARVRW